MPWIIGGAALGGAAISAISAGNAGSTQAKATAKATGEIGRQYDQTRLDQAPYREAGTDALSMLRGMMGLPGTINENDPRFIELRDSLYAAEDAHHKNTFGGMSIYNSPDPQAKLQLDQRVRDNARQQYLERFGNESTAPQGGGELTRKFTLDDFWQDPVTQAGYNYGRDLGEKTLKSMAPLTFGADSGAAIKEATKFGQDYAGTKAGESYNRFTNDQGSVFNKLMALVGGGQVATNQVGAAGTNAGNANANLISAGGNAAGASQIAQGNAFSGALGNLSNWWQQNQTLDKILNRGGISGMNSTPYAGSYGWGNT